MKSFLKPIQRPIKTTLVLLLFLLAAGTLFAQRVPLTINASEGPAQVILDGRLLGVANPQFRGQVAPGTYDLLVRKPGLPEFRQRITVGASGLVVEAALGTPAPAPPPPQYTLNITGNVSGAELFLNNTRAGTLPYRQQLQTGRYEIRVQASGYQDYNTTINLNRNETITVNLQPLPASITVSIPSSLLNRSIQNPASQVELYIDGRRVSGLSTQVQPGRRQVRVVSGGLTFETTIEVRPGVSYTVEPVATLQVR